ncbi:MAG: CHC2 zinc finger domain-containing protein [Maricaulis sp.]|nr:CHC2 zinc finger domain-containing protein [Maricaulis sp.]
MDCKQQTDTLNELTVGAVGRLLGLRLPSSGTICCPFDDHQDKRPSFSTFGGGIRWKCFGCNRTGGAIDFVSTFLDLDFASAKKWLLSKTINLEGAIQVPRPVQHGYFNHNQTKAVAESTPDHEVFAAYLMRCPILPSGLSYLAARGITKTTVEMFSVGQVTSNRQLLNQLVCLYGFERVATAGLYTATSTGQRSIPVFNDNSLVFPFIEKNKITYLQARIFERTKAPKWRNLARRSRRIYNADAIDGKAAKIIICEGVIDTLSAVELGLTPVGLLGVSAQLNSHQMTSLRNKLVCIMLDWDAAGEGRATELKQTLLQYGVASHRQERPSSTANDLNDFLRQKREIQ